MKHFSSRIFIGILTFFVGVSTVMFLYFSPSLQTPTEKPLLSQIQTIPNDSKPEIQLISHEGKTKVLFDGENIDVVEDAQSNFEQVSFKAKPKDELCFQKIEKKIEDKLNVLGFKGKTKYFKFNGQEKVSDNKPFSFTLKLNNEQVPKLNLDFVKKLDSDATNYDSFELYFLKNKQHEYLLLIGHASGTSGIGHLYRYHTLVPLNSNKGVIELDSMFTDPRKIKIDDSGTIYYTQVDSTYFGAAGDVDSANFSVVVSLFTIDGEKSKKFEFNYNCKSQELFEELDEN